MLPGVALIQSALVLLGAAQEKPRRLRSVKVAKFFAPVEPDQVLTVTCDTPSATDAQSISISITSPGRKRLLSSRGINASGLACEAITGPG